MQKFIIALVLMLSCATAVSARDTYSRNPADIPAAAQSFISNTFKAKINLIKIDKKTFGGADYEVILTDGTEVEFDSKGNWKEIEVGASKAIPEKLVPELTRRYVNANHKGQKIVSVDKDRNGYTFGLTDGVEFKTDLSGRFLRYDD